MKIDDKTMTPEISKYVSKTTPNDTQQIEQKPSSDEQKTGGVEQSGQDTVVNLSQASKEAQRIREIMLSEPDVREEKVAELKRKIEAGEYKMDHDAVAAKLVDSFIDEIS